MDTPRGAAASHLLGILFRPSRAWDAIDREPADAGALLFGYVAPLAAIPAVCGVVGGVTFGFSIANIGVRANGIGLALGAAVGLVLTVAGLYLLAVFVELIAPAFGGRPDRGQALKLVAYAPTAS